jgi:hypothetical protein
MNLRKIDYATVLGASFCIGTMLGTYQSDQVTMVNFDNRRQPYIITLRTFLVPARIPSRGFYSSSLNFSRKQYNLIVAEGVFYVQITHNTHVDQ